MSIEFKNDQILYDQIDHDFKNARRVPRFGRYIIKFLGFPALQFELTLDLDIRYKYDAGSRAGPARGLT